jgi:hypothetical protein
MTLDGLLGDTIKGLGPRFNLTGALPTTALFLFILALYWSGVPANAPNLARVLQNAEELGIKEALFLGITVLTFALIVQPLQLSLVRILEGYWGGSWLGGRLSQFGIGLQRRRRKRSSMAETPMTEDTEDVPGEEAARMRLAAWQLRQFYPAESRLLPTRLGNVLRAAEDNAGRRYGLDAVVVWPRLYPLLSDQVTASMADRRDQLDLAVRFCAVFMLAALISAIALLQYGWWLLVPTAALGLAWLSYRAAITAALAYGEGIEAAFDLHRFDLLKALHLPLPADRESEREANRELSDFLRQGVPVNFQYDHEPVKERVSEE